MSRSTSRPLPPPAAYYGGAVWVTIIMLAVVVVRLHEGIPGIRFVKPAFVTALVGGALILARSRRDVIASALRDPLVVRFYVFMGWAAVTMPFALWRGQAIGVLQSLLPSAVLLVVILSCPPTREAVDNVITGLVAACLASTIVLPVLGWREGARLGGVGQYDSNDLALLMAMCSPFALQMLLTRSGWRKWLGGAAVLMMGVTVVRTQSRGGLLAFVASTLVFVFGLRGSSKFLITAALPVVAALSWAVAPPDFKARVATIGEKDYNYTDYTGRKQIWQRARGYIAQHPVMGVGIGNFPIAEGERCRADHRSGCKWSATHNAYLQIASELGLVGLAAWLAMVVLAVRVALRVYVDRRGLPPGAHRPEMLAALTGFLLAAYFLSAGYFFALFALLGLVELSWRTVQSAEESLPDAAPALVPVAASGWRTARSAARPQPPVPLPPPLPAPRPAAHAGRQPRALPYRTARGR